VVGAAPSPRLPLIPPACHLLPCPRARTDALPRVAALGALGALVTAFPEALPPLLGSYHAGGGGGGGARSAASGASPDAAPAAAPDLADGLLAGVLLSLQPRPDLVRSIELGSAVVKIDDGLPLRAAALAALVALLAAGGGGGGGGAAAAAAAPFFVAALGDDAEIKLQAHSALVLLAAAPARPLPALLAARAAEGDALANALGAVIYPAPWGDKDKWKLTITRSALRALHALHAALPALTWAASPAFAALLARIDSAQDLKELYASVQRDMQKL
jgi:hypothetical protein